MDSLIWNEVEHFVKQFILQLLTYPVIDTLVERDMHADYTAAHIQQEQRSRRRTNVVHDLGTES